MNKYLAGLLLSSALVSYSPKEKVVDENITGWGRRELMKKDVSENFVKFIDKGLANMIALSFQEGYVPEKWLKELSLDSWKYNYKKIMKDKYYSWDKDKLIKSIEERTLKGEHIFREDLNGLENSDNLNMIRDKTQLVIIKKYCDFFENKKTGKIMRGLFPEGENSDEYTGVIKDGRKNLEFYWIDTRWQEKYERPRIGRSSKTHVLVPIVVPYIHNIGTLHTHTTKKNKKRDDVSGPSSDDSYSLSKYNEINPYLVNVVVTRIDDEKYNADIYLSEVYDGYGYPMNSPYIFVYDLGVFKFGK